MNRKSTQNIGRFELEIVQDDQHNEYVKTGRTHSFTCYNCDYEKFEKLSYNKVKKLVEEHKSKGHKYLVTIDYTRMDLVERQLQTIEEITGVHLEVEDKTIYGEGFSRYALVKDESDTGIAYCIGMKELETTVTTLQNFTRRIEQEKKEEQEVSA